MIVVDVNIVVYLMTASGKHDLAKALWERMPDWRVPTLWRHEFLNVIATMTREEYLTPGDATALWERGTMLLSCAEMQVDAILALDLALKHRISGYDAQYVALAESLKTPLVTEDARLRKAFPRRCLSLESAVSAIQDKT